METIRIVTPARTGNWPIQQPIDPGHELFSHSFHHTGNLFTFFCLTFSHTEMVQALKTSSLMSRQTGKPAVSTNVCREELRAERRGTCSNLIHNLSSGPHGYPSLLITLLQAPVVPVCQPARWLAQQMSRITAETNSRLKALSQTNDNTCLKKKQRNL